MSVVETEVGAEIIDSATAISWCRADSDNQSILELIVPMARDSVENHIGRSLLERTYVDRRDGFPCSREIKLEFPPLRDVTSVQYLDSNGDLRTMSDSLYVKDVHSTPGRIVLKDGESWPATDYAPNSVIITYEAGYIAAPDEDTPLQHRLPSTLKAAMLFLIAELFSNRESIAFGQPYELPHSFHNMFFAHKVNW